MFFKIATKEDLKCTQHIEMINTQVMDTKKKETYNSKLTFLPSQSLFY